MILRALSALWASAAPPMADHLWQSTLFVVLAAILAYALRKNQGRVRYWVWLTASVKFLIPFSLLIALGSHLAKPRASTAAQAVVYSTVEDFSQPFAGTELPLISQAPAPVSRFHLLPPIIVAVWLVGIVVVLVVWAAGWIRVSLMVRRAVPLGQGPEVEALRRMESSLGVRKPIRLVLSRNWMEPGIFGIFRPVLLWPEGISRHLDDKHIDAILAHEIYHARRHDNLTAILHMLVEAIFWFHPLVWWMGARLEEERERACDEEVSLLCNQPHVYAESILRVCKFCSESPLACVSGITGADLKKRIMQIMTERVARKLNLRRKLLLFAVGLTVVAVPIVLGQAKAAQRMMLAAVDKAPIPIRTAAHAMIALKEAPSMGEIAEVHGEGQAPIGTATAAAPEMAGRISGTLLYPNGKPVAGGMVLLTGARPGQNPEELSAKTAEDGRFAFDHLRYTDYWFGAEKEDEAYEDALAVSVRGGERLTKPDGVALSASAPASEVVLKLATKMGIFTGTVENQATHEPVAAKLVFSEPLGTYDGSGHRYYHWFFVKEVKGPFRVLVPPDKDLFLSVSADGYRTWFYPAGSGESYPDRPGHPWPPVHFKPGEQKGLQIELEPKATASAVPVAMVQEKATQAGAPSAPANPTTNIAATWQGTLQTGRNLRFVAKITRAGDGTLRAIFYNIDGEPGGIPAISTTLNGTFLKLELPFATYEGTLSADGNSMSGTWRQGSNPLPLSFARATPETEWTVPQPPPRMATMAADANPTFEVATIKPSRPDEHGPRYDFQGRRFSVIHVSLSQLIQYSYELQQSQIAKAQDWVNSESYDISAVPDGAGEPSWKQWQSMVEKLMADRFQLKFHLEKQEQSVYLLTVVKTGPKLTKSETAPGAPGGNGFGPDGFGATNETMADVARALGAGVLHRPVVDQTGLSGRFNLRLTWTPDGTATATENPNGPPDFFTAIQEQLGLKLVSTKAPVDVLVIDHVERPSAN